MRTAEILEMLNRGDRQCDIAAKLKVSKQFVHSIARKAGMTKTIRQKKAVKAEHEKEVREAAVKMKEDGYGYKRIAAALDISLAAVKRVLHHPDVIAKHGGWRPGGGRPRSAEKKVRIGISLIPEDHQLLLDMGQGNASRGVVAALECCKTADN